MKRRHPTRNAPSATVHMRRVRVRGVTLTEVLVVIGIIALLASISMLGYEAVFAGGDRAEAQAMIDRLYVALEGYRLEHGGYPEDESEATDEYFITDRPRDPLDPEEDADDPGGILWRLNHEKVFDGTEWTYVEVSNFAYDREWLDPVTGRLLDPWGQPYEYELGDSRGTPEGIDNPDGPPNWDALETDGESYAAHEPRVAHPVKIFSWGEANQDLPYDEKEFDRHHLIYRRE